MSSRTYRGRDRDDDKNLSFSERVAKSRQRTGQSNPYEADDGPWGYGGSGRSGRAATYRYEDPQDESHRSRWSYDEDDLSDARGVRGYRSGSPAAGTQPSHYGNRPRSYDAGYGRGYDRYAGDDGGYSEDYDDEPRGRHSRHERGSMARSLARRSRAANVPHGDDEFGFEPDDTYGSSRRSRSSKPIVKIDDVAYYEEGRDRYGSGGLHGAGRESSPILTTMGGGFGDSLRRLFSNRRFLAVLALIIVIIVAAMVVRHVRAEAAAKAEAEAAAAAAANPQATQEKTASIYEGVDDPWVPGGKFTTGDQELDQMVKEICDEHTTEGDSASDNAFSTWCYVTRLDYIETDYNQNPSGPGWAIEYAKQVYNDKAANCYSFVAMASFCLRYFGYEDAVAEPCVIEKQSGDWGQHGLMFVTNIETGEKCLCDPSKSANGWMLKEDIYNYYVEDIGQNTERSRERAAEVAAQEAADQADSDDEEEEEEEY